VLLLAGVLALAHRHQDATSRLALDERALDLVTSSDVKPLRLGAAAGEPAEMHANYRARPGTDVAVLSLSNLAPVPAGQVYQAWLRHEGAWTSLGTAVPDADGKARIVAQDPALAAPPEALEVKREPAPGSAAPNGPPALAWPTP
jgi:anti-sigma-K factor RskA